MSAHHQLLYHIVFSTKNRKPFLRSEDFRNEVFSYMAGTVREFGGYALRIGGYYEHAHLLIRIPAKIAVSHFVGQVKANTSKHINGTSGQISKFGWQDGFGAFSVSVSMKDRVCQYIENQFDHHSSETFESEYLSLLTKHEVEFDPKYVWD